MHRQEGTTRRAMLGATMALGALGTAGRAVAQAPAGPIVRTDKGPVRGRTEGGLQVFRGLRYAAPPTGPLRFRPPQPIAAWTAPADAGAFGNAAMQTPGADAPPSETHSEDCLFLNVWTAGLDDARRPVMVWLHGGGFWEGAAGRPTYYGDHFARDGIVLVSVNHRLNVFGYAQMPDSWGPDYASSGLAGMLDIVAALRWVKANIARFGGDPDNVTIFGESGGGAKVSLLLGMPPARGLFHKAVIQSGAALDAAPRPYAQALGGALIERLGIRPGDTAALAKIDGKTIFDAQTAAVAQVKDQAPKGFLVDSFVPSIDGDALPRGPFAPEASPLAADIPLLIGTNRDEATLFLLRDQSIANETETSFAARVREAFPADADRIVAGLKAAYPGATPRDLAIALSTVRMFWFDTIRLAERKLGQPAPVWMYRMDWDESPFAGGQLKAAHALELSFVFATYDNIRFFVGPGDGPARMAALMHPAWVAFAKTGNPQTTTLPTWPRYDLQRRETMIFDTQPTVASDPMGALREAMTAAVGRA